MEHSDLNTTFSIERNARLDQALSELHYIIRRLCNEVLNDVGTPLTICEISEQTGISEEHLRSIFFEGETLSLLDYIILSKYADVNPIAEYETNTRKPLNN